MGWLVTHRRGCQCNVGKSARFIPLHTHSSWVTMSDYCTACCSHLKVLYCAVHATMHRIFTSSEVFTQVQSGTQGSRVAPIMESVLGSLTSLARETKPAEFMQSMKRRKKPEREFLLNGDACQIREGLMTPDDPFHTPPLTSNCCQQLISTRRTHQHLARNTKNFKIRIFCEAEKQVIFIIQEKFVSAPKKWKKNLRFFLRMSRFA